MLISEIIKIFNLPVHAPGINLDEIDIHSVAAIDRAGEGQIGFFTAMEFAPLLAKSPASALIVREVVDSFKGVQLIHKDPQFIFAKLAMIFYRVNHGAEGISPDAFIDPTVKLGKNVSIQRRAHIEAGAEIGDDVVIYPGVFVGRNVKIGKSTVIHPNAVIYYDTVIGENCLIHASAVLGADGFGFSVSGGEICKIPQVGRVRIGNNVEIGALSTIDRAANHETIVEDNCKFDDHVHIAHNSVIGANSMFSAQVGIAGSSTLGKWTLIGGQSGVGDHLKLPDGLRVGAKSGVVTQIDETGTYMGFPAIPASEWRRNLVYTKRLKDYDQTLKSLQKRLAELEAKLKDS